MKFETTSIFEKNLDAYLDPNVRYIVNQGGTWSSKTFSILQLLYIISCKQKKMISIVSETVPHLKKGAIRDFQGILENSKQWNENSYNRTDMIYSVDPGKMEFFSAEDSGKVRGPRRDILYLNEANNIVWEVFDQMQMRTRGKIFLDYNPVSEFWVHEHLIALANCKLIHSTYKDNKFVDKAIIELIESRSDNPKYENWYRVYGLGEIGSLEGAIIKDWVQCDQFPDDCEWEAYGLDFGYAKDPAALVKVGMKEGQVYLQELFYETGLVNVSIEVNGVIKPNISDRFENLGLRKNYDEIYCDSANPVNIDELAYCGWHVIGARKGPDSVMTGLDILNRYPINVTKESLNMIKELRNYTWQENRLGVTIPKPVDNWNHLIDAARYVAIMKLGEQDEFFMEAMN